jgi:hypothetical protein
METAHVLEQEAVKEARMKEHPETVLVSGLHVSSSFRVGVMVNAIPQQWQRDGP